MGRDQNPSKRGGEGRFKNKKSRDAHSNFREGSCSKKDGERRINQRNHPRKGLSDLAKTSPALRKHLDPSKQAPIQRKIVDPEMKKYFLEIARLLDSNEVDLEEYSALCGNALEETRGKEVELANDVIISHTLQNLLEGCDLEQLCGFLRSCAKGFPLIAIDKAGSHVAETALKALARHLQDEESHAIIEETLTKICQVLVVDATDVMCSRYGSHVLRSLICLCKGIPFDSLEEFHATKQSAVLAERLNLRPDQRSGGNPLVSQHGFADVFGFLVREMLNNVKDDITSLREDKYSSFVLQAMLRLLVGNDQELIQAIRILLCYHEGNVEQGKIIEPDAKEEIMNLLKDTASSHLLEVIMEVAPDALYNELLDVLFRGSLYELSCHHCGNFVVQALISSVRTRDQMELIWMELGPKLKELLEVGKSGVVASILAACHRLQTCSYECSQSLAVAVSSEPESSSSIVPHLLFLESYLRKKSSWKWPEGDKMHTLGCLMLQTIFKYPNHSVISYITSIASMESDQIYQTAKDAGGSRVLESFLASDASAKQKVQLITKLQDHFGELSVHPSSSFTVEKCFAASNLFLKVAIAKELQAVQTELSKTKHGPYLLKKLDIDGFARQPEQWKLSQAAKVSAYTEFQAMFGSVSSHGKQGMLDLEYSQKPVKKKPRRHEKINDEANHSLDPCTAMATQSLGCSSLGTSVAKLGFPEHKHGLKKGKFIGGSIIENSNTKLVSNHTKIPFVRKPGRRKSSADELGDLAAKGNLRKPGRRNSSVDELANLAAKGNLSVGDVHKLFRSDIKGIMEHSGNDNRHFLKKLKK